MRFWKGASLILGVLLCGAAPAFAIGEDGPERVEIAVQRADRIVRALAVAESALDVPRRSKSRSQEVRTDWRLRIKENWKGEMPPARHLTLRVIGSRSGDVVQTIEGEPRLTRGGEYLFFLRADSADAVWRPSSVAWGCLPIERGMLYWPHPGESPRVTVQRLRRKVQTIIREVPSDADTARSGR